MMNTTNTTNTTHTASTTMDSSEGNDVTANLPYPQILAFQVYFEQRVRLPSMTCRDLGVFLDALRSLRELSEELLTCEGDGSVLRKQREESQSKEKYRLLKLASDAAYLKSIK